MIIECHWLGLEPPPLRGAGGNLVLSPGRKGGRHYQEWAPMKGIWSIEINKTDIQPDIVLTSGNHQTLPQCGKEGVVFCGFPSSDVKRC